MTNITVLGGSGFIGSRLVTVLRQQGHQVHTPSRREVDFFQPKQADVMAV